MTAPYWQDYWAAGGKGDQVITKEAQRAFLSRHWREVAAVCADRTGAVLVDIASGDGAALKWAREGARADAFMIAIDVSPSAIAAAVAHLPGLTGAAADAARLPIANRAADIVISQFGLEYAGEAAFAEVARVLKPGGVFSSISHYRGGVIEAECAENERVLEALAHSQVILRAREALIATYGDRAPEPQLSVDAATAENAFRNAARDLAADLPEAPNLAAKRAIAFFLGELGALSARRLAYEPREALHWLDHHAHSFAAYSRRMRSMREAALGEDAIARIGALFRDRGFSNFTAEPIRFEDSGPFAAWRIVCGR